jgi:hypothetical protein
LTLTGILSSQAQDTGPNDDTGLKSADDLAIKAGLSFSKFQATGLSGFRSQRMITENRGFCYLSGLQGFSASETCEVVLQRGEWFLNSQSNSGSFSCEATCVTGSSVLEISPETRITGQVGNLYRGIPSTRTLGSNSFCFLTGGRNLDGNTNKVGSNTPNARRCQVYLNQGVWSVSGLN